MKTTKTTNKSGTRSSTQQKRKTAGRRVISDTDLKHVAGGSTISHRKAGKGQQDYLTFKIN